MANGTTSAWRARQGPIRIGAVVALALAIAFVVWLLVRGNDNSTSKPAATPTPPPPAVTKPVRTFGPVAATVAKLRVIARARPVYWAGPKRGVTYELTQSSNGRTFIRYLPKGVRVGSRRHVLRPERLQGASEGREGLRRRHVQGPAQRPGDLQPHRRDERLRRLSRLELPDRGLRPEPDPRPKARAKRRDSSDFLTLLAAWVLVPLVLGVLALGCGLLLEVAAGTRLPWTLLVPVGFALVVCASQFPTLSGGAAILAAPLVF